MYMYGSYTYIVPLIILCIVLCHPSYDYIQSPEYKLQEDRDIDTIVDYLSLKSTNSNCWKNGYDNGNIKNNKIQIIPLKISWQIVIVANLFPISSGISFSF